MKQRGEQALNSHLNQDEQELLEKMRDNLILSHEAKIAIREMALTLHVSPSYLISLAKKMNLTGYAELCFFLKRSPDFPTLSAFSQPEPFYQDYLEKIDAYLTAANLNDHQTDTFIISAELSNVATLYLIKRLALLGIHAFEGAPLGNHQRPKNLIFISFTGENKDSLDIAQQFQAETICCITASHESQLAALADHLFYIPSLNSNLAEVPNYFVPKALYFIELLVSRLQLSLAAKTD